MTPSRTALRELVKAEVIQRREEGCRVGPVERALADQRLSAERLEELLARLARLTVRPDFGFEEPSTLAAIRRLRPRRRRQPAPNLKAADIENRILGGWLGRAAGCCLGKPVEGRSKKEIEDYLTSAGAFPLDDYFPAPDPRLEGLPFEPRPAEAMRPNIHFMPRDDDMDYPIIGLDILEDHGPAFTSEQVIDRWLLRLPYHCVYTAERAAYRNRVMGLSPPATATTRNPCREWIGAQIRADIWGWVSPGRPEQAAELAFRDAAVSHVKNGTYGAMFVAAMLAAAFTTDDVTTLIQAGLGEIPRRCRLRAAVDLCLRTADRLEDWDEAWQVVMAEVGHYHRVHTINNACLVVLALLYGSGDFGKTICAAVQGGLDTDCNGATAGSIAGVMLGAAAIPAKWAAPLNDRLMSYVAGFHESRISDLARRTAAAQRRACAHVDA